MSFQRGANHITTRSEYDRARIDAHVKRCIKVRTKLTQLRNESPKRAGRQKMLNHFLENRLYEEDYGYIDNFIYLFMNEEIEIKSVAEVVSNVWKRVTDIQWLEVSEISSNEIEFIDWYSIENNESLRFKMFILYRYREFLSKKAQELISNRESLVSLNKITTVAEICRILSELDREVLDNYLEDMIEKKFLRCRRPLKYFYVLEELFCKPGQMSRHCNNMPHRFDMYNHIKEFVDSKKEDYYKQLVDGNKTEISLQKDRWVVVQGDYIDNVFKYFDFSSIESESFKYEVKLYMMDRIKNSSLEKINSLSLLLPCVKYLCDEGCDSFGCIELEDVVALYFNQVEAETWLGRNYSITTIRKQLGEMKKATNYLIEYQAKNILKTKRIDNNYFNDISFKNIHNMHKKTEIIPEEVIDALIEHKDELGEYELLFDIFINTGIRLKQVLDLTKNCLEYSEKAKSYMLTFRESKNRNYAKKVSRDPFRQLLIPDELAERIQQKIESTEEIREKFSKDNIFIKFDKGRNVPTLLNARGINKKFNDIIQKYNIVDANGELWKFKTRQIRKTVVANMIENGATKTEVAYVLGHFNMRTLENYYEDVRQKRVDDMNNDFFKNKFKINIGEDNLKQFTEEERKVLYIEFLSNYRRTELGYCSKHYSEGVCGKFVGGAKCSKCNKLCTGKEFESKWRELLDSTKKEIELLEKFYEVKNIPEDIYVDFREYQIQINNLQIYEDILKKM